MSTQINSYSKEYVESLQTEMLDYRREIDSLKDEIVDRGMESNFLKAERDKYFSLFNDSQEALELQRQDFKSLYSEYQDLKTSLAELVQVILVKDKEWDLKSVLVAVDSHLPDSLKNELQNNVDKVKAHQTDLSQGNDILRKYQDKYQKDNYETYNVINEDEMADKSFNNNSLNNHIHIEGTTELNSNQRLASNYYTEDEIDEADQVYYQPVQEIKPNNSVYKNQKDKESNVYDESAFNSINVDYSQYDFQAQSKANYESAERNKSPNYNSNNFANKSIGLLNNIQNLNNSMNLNNSLNHMNSNHNNSYLRSIPRSESRNATANQNNSNFTSNKQSKDTNLKKYRRRDDSVELFSGQFNHSNCNITKSFESSMDYSKSRYQTILSSAKPDLYFSDGNDAQDNAGSFLGKINDIKSALNNSRALVESFDNNCLDFDLVNDVSYQDLHNSMTHSRRLVRTQDSSIHSAILNQNANSRINRSQDRSIIDDKPDYQSNFKFQTLNNSDIEQMKLSDYKKNRQNVDDIYSRDISEKREYMSNEERLNSSSQKKVRFSTNKYSEMDQDDIQVFLHDKENEQHQSRNSSIQNSQKNQSFNNNPMLKKKNLKNAAMQNNLNSMSKNASLFDKSMLTISDHIRKFEMIGTGTIKLSKKSRTFKKVKGKGINAVVRYPLSLSEGRKVFKVKVANDPNEKDNFMCFAFEKPYKSNYICKTRMMQNGIGITSTGLAYGQYNNLKSNFSVQSGDVVECIIDFDSNLVKYSLNGVLVYEGVHSMERAYFIVYLKSIGESIKIVDVCL